MHAAAVAHVAAAAQMQAHTTHASLSHHHSGHLGHGPPPKRKRRHRTIFTEEQLEQLEATFGKEFFDFFSIPWLLCAVLFAVFCTKI